MRLNFRSNVAWGLYGLLLGAGAMSSLFIGLIRISIIQEERSPYNFTETVQAITANAVNRGWKVTTVDSVQARLAAESGSGPVQVLELCHAEYACQLARSGRRSCLAMMPCSVAIYERNGQVYVASLNRGLVGRLYRREAADVLRKVRADEREIFRFIATHH
jgi:uncharacterized protein (DUF302 family)